MKNIFISIIVLLIASVLIASTTHASDLWDRPITQFNETTFNESLNLILNNYVTYSYLNSTLQNYYNKSQIDDMLSMITDDDSMFYTKTETDILLSSKLDSADQRYNDTALIQTVNNSLQIHEFNYSFTMNSNAVITSPPLWYVITEVRITPNNIGDAYTSELIDGNGDMIDRNREEHTNVWDIFKYHAINTTVITTINSSFNDSYDITIFGLRQG